MFTGREKIEVFKTDVGEVSKAREFIASLRRLFPGAKINFDLDDCDKILRIEGDNISVEKVIGLLSAHDHICETLE